MDTLRPAGVEWCALFPTSTALVDLVEPFRTSAKRFISALQTAGATVSVKATYRPVERAYLMHWSAMLKQPGGQDPATVPLMVGVPIDWTCGGNIAAARKAAAAMAAKYGIVYPPALVSRHTQRLAVDMSIHWTGTTIVVDAFGNEHDATHLEDLYPIGKTYGIFKLVSDPPHWSSDGH